MSEELRPDAQGPVLSRDKVVAALSEHFAADHIDVDELERRLDVAHRTASPGDLRKLLTDLPALTSSLPATRDPTPGKVASARSIPAPFAGDRRPLAAEHEVRESQMVLGFWSSGSRGGSWVPARRIIAVAVQGGVELDFRDARFAEGITRLRVFAMMGGVEVIVPPDLRVECDGIGIMGAFEQSSDPDARPDPDGPVLRISGLAFMGGVNVTVRFSGETSRDARSRLKEHRKRRRIENKKRRRLLGR